MKFVLAYRIARRLRLAEGGSSRSTTSVRVSIAGVALSIAVMLLTVAIVRGFKQQITGKIVGFDSQIRVDNSMSAYGDGVPVTLTSELREAVAVAIPGAEISLAVTQPGMLKTDDNFSAVVFRSYDTGHDFSFVRDNIVEGKMPAYDDLVMADSIANDIVISTDVARGLGLKVGDRIPAAFVIDGKMRMRNFNVAALYCSNFGEYDKVIAYAPFNTLRRLRGLDDDQSTSVEISGLPFEKIDEAAHSLRSALSSAYYQGQTSDYYQVTTVIESGALYFNWLELLDGNVVVIISLMAAISIFTLIASLFILILEKVRMIGTFKTIGAPDRLIRRIFILLATRIMFYGMVIGNVIGLAFIFIQHQWRVLPLDPQAYYISFVPVDITIWQVAVINVVALVAAYVVMILPSMVISRMQPARIVRFD